MKQKVILFGLIIVLGMVTTVNAQTKIGYTNVELLMAYMPEVKQAESTLRAYELQLSKTLGEKRSAYDAKLQQYGQLRSGLSTEDDQKWIQELQAMEQEIRKSADDADRKLVERRQTLLAPITQKIQSKIDEVAKEGNFTYILNQTSGTNILYGLETMNVTEQLAAKLGINMN